MPTDFSASSDIALKRALALAKRFDACLQLVYVVPVHYPIGDVDYYDYFHLAADLREYGRQQLDTWAKNGANNGVIVQTSVLYGCPATEICKAVDELKTI